MKLKFISAQSITSSSVLQPSILDTECTGYRIKHLERRAGIKWNQVRTETLGEDLHPHGNNLIGSDKSVEQDI